MPGQYGKKMKKPMKKKAKKIKKAKKAKGFWNMIQLGKIPKIDPLWYSIRFWRFIVPDIIIGTMIDRPAGIS